MNPELLQRPKKVNPKTNRFYIYSPTIIASDLPLKAGEVVRVLEVFKGDTVGTTTLKVMRAIMWRSHRYYRKNLQGETTGCVRWQEGVQCECERYIEHMPEEIKKHTFIVQLSDIGF